MIAGNPDRLVGQRTQRLVFLPIYLQVWFFYRSICLVWVCLFLTRASSTLGLSSPERLDKWSGPQFLPLLELEVLVSTSGFPFFRNRRLSPLVLPPRGHESVYQASFLAGGISLAQRVGNPLVEEEKNNLGLSFLHTLS